MPRERVVLCQRTPAPGANDPRGSYHVALDIGWASDSGHVSIGLVGISDDTSDVFHSDELAADGLSYMQLNALIRHLRRARDGAFGKPE